MLIKVPVVADVGEVVTVLTVLAVGEVTVVGVVVLSIRTPRTVFRSNHGAFLQIYNHLFNTYYIHFLASSSQFSDTTT